MITRKVGKTGIFASLLGFGAMRLPTGKNGRIDYEDALLMVDAAYNSGVNYFDTAYVYHDGESEVFLGEALKKYPRESFYLADKMPMFSCDKEADVERIFKEQQARVKTDYFDFYLMHSLSRSHWDKAKKFKALDKILEKKKQGKIKYIGFSYHGDFDTYVEVLDYYDWDFVQLQINYIDDVKLEARKFNDELIKRNIPLIVMEPVRGGFLANLPDAVLKELGMPDNKKTAELAFRWCLGYSNLAVILSGMSNLSQVEQNLESFKDLKPLTDKELKNVARARDKILNIKTVPCTGCNYCSECPAGVDISRIFGIYNDFKLYKNAFDFKGAYGALKEKSGKYCTSCETCLPLCPQGIDIPARLKGIVDEEAVLVL